MPLILSVFSTESQDRKFIPSPIAISHSRCPISVPAVTRPRDPRHFESAIGSADREAAGGGKEGRVKGHEDTGEGDKQGPDVL